MGRGGGGGGRGGGGGGGAGNGGTASPQGPSAQAKAQIAASDGLTDIEKEVAGRVIDKLDAKIEDLDSRIASLSIENRRRAFEENPVADTGGIRSRSERQREQSMNRTLANAREAVELSRERDTFISSRRFYINQILEKGRYTAILNSGVIPETGERLRRQTISSLRTLIRRATVSSDRIERETNTRRFERL